jgi:hypothetical protein
MDQLPSFLSLCIKVISAGDWIPKVDSIPDILFRDCVLLALGADIDLHKRLTLIARTMSVNSLEQSSPQLTDHLQWRRDASIIDQDGRVVRLKREKSAYSPSSMGPDCMQYHLSNNLALQ